MKAVRVAGTPTSDGLGRIVALCERAYRFTYAGRRMQAAMPRDMYPYVEDIVEQIMDVSVQHSVFQVILLWKRELGCTLLHSTLFDAFAVALESWADPAVAAHFDSH